MTLLYTMSLIDKIPPLVSALAFGYGVGMAAPESTITSMQAAVAGPPGGAPAMHAAAAPAATAPAAALLAAPRPPEGRAPAGESRELTRLREVAARDVREAQGAAACDLDRPTHSRSPRYASTRDGFVEDVDDLDAAGTEALSKLQLPDLPLSITRRTLKYVRFFTRTDRGRDMFESWLKRSGRYQELIQAELREWRLPEDLIWLAMIESGFDARARSPAGAVGLWQFMPATGEVYGLQQSRHLDQRKNPRLATQAAAHHLRDLYLRFGNWDLALAAYNMGYEQLLDRIDRYGTSDFNELARQEALPSETSAYVPKVAAAAIVANNLERFGFDGVELSRPTHAAEIAVPPGTPLKTLAKAAGVSTAAIRTLNPDLLQDKVPPGRGDYLVLVPADTLARAQAALPAMLDREPLDDEASVLNPVDLLGGRAFDKTRVRRQEDSLLALLPPAKKRRAMRDPVPGLDEEAPEEEAREEARPAPRRPRSGRRTMLYRVGPGDTLIGVARQFAVDVDDVARDNGLDADAKLRAGALIKLRVRPDLVEAAAAAAPKEAGEGAERQDVRPGTDRPAGRSGAAKEPERARPAPRDRRKQASG